MLVIYSTGKTRTSNLRLLRIRNQHLFSGLYVTIILYRERTIMWNSSESSFVMFIYATVFILYIIHVNTATATENPLTTTAQGQLIRDLFDTGYDVREVPHREHDGPIEVRINFYLYSILELDTKNGILRGVSFANFIWYDHRLVWNPETHGNISMLVIPVTSVWRPPLQLYNMVGSGKAQSPFQTDDNVVQVWSDGMVYLQSNIYHSTICDVLLLTFPRDEHDCRVGFVALGYTEDFIRLVPGLALSLFHYNAEWHVNNLTLWAFNQLDANSGKPISLLDVMVFLKRQPNFYLRNILCPLVLLNVLGFATFWIPIKSGERVSASLSLVLGNTIFQIIITDIMPRTSNPDDEPRIVYFCVSSFALIVTTTVWSMLVSNLSAKQWRLRSSTARRFFFDVLPVLILSNPVRRCTSQNAVEDVSQEDDGKQQEENDVVQLFDQTTIQTPAHHAQQPPADKREHMSQMSDMEVVAEMFDRIVMIVVFVLLLVIAIRCDPLIRDTFVALFE